MSTSKEDGKYECHIARAWASPEGQFWKACEDGDLQTAKLLIERHPGLDVNWCSGEMGFTRPLFEACCSENIDLIKFLMAHPTIQMDSWNCERGMILKAAIHYPATLRLLLSDRRVLVNEAFEDDTALSIAAERGYAESVKWLVASGRELDLGVGRPHNALERAEEPDSWMGLADAEGKIIIAALLREFMQDSSKARHRIRMELSALDELARVTFALVVFLCDNFLALADNDRMNLDASRFFRMAQKLPMDLQMVLCHRSVGSTKISISGRDSDIGFIEVAAMFCGK